MEEQEQSVGYDTPIQLEWSDKHCRAGFEVCGGPMILNARLKVESLFIYSGATHHSLRQHNNSWDLFEMLGS